MTFFGVRRGEMFPEFVLPTIDGAPVDLERYRARSNLVIMLAGDERGPATTSLLIDLVALKAELAAEVAQVVLVLATRADATRRSEPWPFPVLVDAGALIHHRIGATDALGRPVPALFITDRFREIYAAWMPAEHAVMPSATEVMEWLEFINIQCPECGAPDWPSS
jgi:peroxiredoxin